MRPDNQFPSSLLPAGSAGEHLPLALLRQYVAGTLPAAEQYRVERHTQACSRCADVLEGLAQTDLATTDQALASLQGRLRARVAELEPEVAPPGVVPLWPWRQLAAVVLLLLVGTGVWLGVRRSTEGPASVPPLAQRRPPASPETYATAPVPPAAAQSAISEAEVATLEAQPAPPTAKPALRPADYAAATRPARRVPRVPDAATEQSALSDIASASAAAPVQADSTLVAFDRGKPLATIAKTGEEQKIKQEVVVAAAAGRAAAKRKAATARTQAAAAPQAISGMAKEGVIDAAALRAETRMVRGRITDRTTGQGLGGVQVRVKNGAAAVSTAPDGSFRVAVPATSTTLTVERTGYIATDHPLPADSSALTLTLVPAPKPTDPPVLVRREGAPTPIDLAATPAGGQQAFRNYLRDSLEYPEKALKEEKEGSVKLSFVVNVDGKLQDIKVVKGLTAECDAEAIRLLKEGPAWHPAIIKGRRTARTVQLSIPFRIADQQ